MAEPKTWTQEKVKHLKSWNDHLPFLEWFPNYSKKSLNACIKLEKNMLGDVWNIDSLFFSLSFSSSLLMSFTIHYPLIGIPFSFLTSCVRPCQQAPHLHARHVAAILLSSACWWRCCTLDWWHNDLIKLSYSSTFLTSNVELLHLMLCI